MNATPLRRATRSSDSDERGRHARLPALVAALAIGTSSLACAPEPEPELPVYKAIVQSRNYTIDDVYRSMKGPKARQAFRLGDAQKPEQLWITGYSSRIVDPETGAQLSDEFMCHSNLGFKDLAEHKSLFGNRPGRQRMFTLSQGQMDLQFPKGFGIPVLSSEQLVLDTQVLNLNRQDEVFDVRHETTIHFVRQADLKEPMTPLFQVAAQAMVLVEGDNPYWKIENPDPEVHGPGCMVAAPASEQRFIDDQQQFVGHWVVPPGRQENRTNVTGWMQLKKDTRIHAIAVHLHPFAESIALRDLTTGETIYESTARGSENRIGLDHVESYSSAEGIPIFGGHQYELVSVYDNTTDEDQDAMALLYLYMADQGFEPPDIEALHRAGVLGQASRSEELGEPEGA